MLRQGEDKKFFLKHQNIAILNLSTELKEITLRTALTAIQSQIDSNFKTIWLKTASLLLYSCKQYPPPAFWKIIIGDSDEQLDKLNVKDYTKDGKPLVRISLERCKIEHKMNYEWCFELSKQILNMLVDPELKTILIEDYPTEEDDEGNVLETEKYGFAFDICSPCQNAYEITGYPVANFVRPEWFMSENILKNVEDIPETFDFCETLSKPFELSDKGYIQIYDFSSGEWSMLKGEHAKRINTKPHSQFDKRIKGRKTWEKSSY